jgi:hypothetical protein
LNILKTYPKKTKLLRLIVPNKGLNFLPLFQIRLNGNIRRNTKLISTGSSEVYSKKYKVQYKLGFFNEDTNKKILLKVSLRQMSKDFNIYNLKIEITKKEYE